jgi:hypothetical protein
MINFQPTNYDELCCLIRWLLGENSTNEDIRQAIDALKNRNWDYGKDIRDYWKPQR